MDDAELGGGESADSIDTSATGVAFSSRTLEVIGKLGGESQPLGDMLLGAWATLESVNNPDMLAQAAHSIRELIEKAPYYIERVPIVSKDPKTPGEELRRSQVRSLVTVYVGNGGQTSRQIVEAQTDAIMSLRNYFVTVSHHRETSLEELKREIAALETILLNFLDPRPIEDLDELDALIAQGEASLTENVVTEVLAIINKSQVAQDYFFSKISSPAWLEPLKERGLFTTPSSEIRIGNQIQFPYWAAGQYLARIADRAQDEVMRVIESLPDTDNERVTTSAVEALLNIDATKAVEATEKIKGYIKKPQYLLFGQALTGLIVKFSNEGVVDSAIELAKLALEVMPDPEAESKKDEEWAWLYPVTRWRDYDYGEMVNAITPALALAAPDRAVSMYANLINSAVRYNESKVATLDEAEDVDTIQDMSRIWRPVIEDGHESSSQPRHKLIDAFIDSLQALVATEKISDSDKAKKLNGILGMKLESIKRSIEYALRGKELSGDLRLIHEVLYAEFESIIKQPAIQFGSISAAPDRYALAQKEFDALDDDALIEKLSTYEPESHLYSDQEALSNNLGVAAKIDPDRFITLLPKIASTKYMYLNTLISTFLEDIDSLSPGQIGKIMTTLNQVLSAEAKDHEGARDYYKWARSSATRFVEKAFDKNTAKQAERITIDGASAALDLILILCRDTDPTVAHEEDEDDGMDPSSLSINSVSGQAMHALIHAMVWANRNKVDTEFMDKVFTELDWHLVENNDSSHAIRSVYGWYFSTIWGTRGDWAMANKEKIFSDDRLGQTAADAYTSYSRVHPDAIELLGSVFERQIPRLASKPDEKKRGIALEGLKHLVQHLSLHYWYGHIDLAADSLMTQMLEASHTKYLSEIINFIGFRLYKADENKLKITKQELSRLSSLWGYMVALTEKDDSKKEALADFGTWFASGKFNDDWSLDQLIVAIKIAGSIDLDFAVLKRLEKLAEAHSAKAVTVIDSMVDGAARDRWSIGTWRDNAVSILSTAYHSTNESTKRAASTLANKLVNMGYTEYRSVIK